MVQDSSSYKWFLVSKSIEKRPFCSLKMLVTPLNGRFENNCFRSSRAFNSSASLFQWVQPLPTTFRGRTWPGLQSSMGCMDVWMYLKCKDPNRGVQAPEAFSSSFDQKAPAALLSFFLGKKKGERLQKPRKQRRSEAILMNAS